MIQCIMREIRLDVLVPRRHDIVYSLQRPAHATGRVLALLHLGVLGVKPLLRIMVIMGHAIVSAVDEVEARRHNDRDSANGSMFPVPGVVVSRFLTPRARWQLTLQYRQILPLWMVGSVVCERQMSVSTHNVWKGEAGEDVRDGGRRYG